MTPETKFRRAALLAGAAALWLLAQPGCMPKGRGGFSMPPMPVETSIATAHPIQDRFEAVGTIEGGEAITVVSEIDAMVVSLPFREGQGIAQGGLIARLDDTQLKADAERAEAVRDQSKITFDRVKSVVDQNAGTPEDMDNAAANLKVAEANLAAARSRLSKTRIVAPWPGIVGSRKVSPGAFLRAGSAITELAQVNHIKVSFSAPERYLSSIRTGSAVSISTTAYPGYQLAGTIKVVEPVLDPDTRSARVVATALNPGGKFRPGMSADVAAVLASRPKALTVPAEAVLAEGDQTYVYVVKADSTVSKVAVTLGSRTPELVEVVKGLDPGARVVRAGHQKVFEGAKVIPVTAEMAAAMRSAATGGGAGGPGGKPGAAAPGAKGAAKK